MDEYYGSEAARVRRAEPADRLESLAGPHSSPQPSPNAKPKLGVRGWARAGAAVAARPRLWATALRQYRRAVPTAWWRHAPYVPAPSRRYLAFRLETAYGPGAEPRPADIVDYLDWCRAQERRERAH